MQLAKPHLDVGLFTGQREAQLAFWQQTVGLAFDHIGKLGGGLQQLRHHANGSIIKVNHARDRLPPAPPSGIVGVRIARPGLGVRSELADPDGNRVALVPPGEDGVTIVVVDERRVARSDDWRAPGWRYLTVQVHDCVAEHAGIVARGGQEGAPPRVLGEAVRYSFVRDPDGNFIEISQRASLVGSLD